MRVWHKTFKAGNLDTGTKDKARSGRPRSGRSATNIAKVDAQLQTDRRQSIREVSNATGIPRATVQRIIRKDLKLRHVSAKFVPRILDDAQKAFRVQLAQQNLDRFEQEGLPFLQRIITGDESSLPTFDPDTKIRDSQWIAPGVHRPRKALRARTRQSTMLTTFFDCNGMVHHEFLRRGGSITAEEYCAVLGGLKEKIWKKRPHLWVMEEGYRRFLLHHDNATPHTAIPTLAHLGENHMEMIAHPPYSPDMAPNDYFLFPELKSWMRGQVYRNIAQVQAAAVEILRSIPQEKFEAVIKELPVRWAKCVKANGDYFEGDNIQIPDFMVEVSDSESQSSSEDDNWLGLWSPWPMLVSILHVFLTVFHMFTHFVGMFGMLLAYFSSHNKVYVMFQAEVVLFPERNRSILRRSSYILSTQVTDVQPVLHFFASTNGDVGLSILNARCQSERVALVCQFWMHDANLNALLVCLLTFCLCLCVCVSRSKPAK